jgi:hypothetical protein
MLRDEIPSRKAAASTDSHSFTRVGEVLDWDSFELMRLELMLGATSDMTSSLISEKPHHP